MSIYFSGQFSSKSPKAVGSKSTINLSQKRDANYSGRWVGYVIKLLVFGAIFFVMTLVFLPIFLAALCVFGLVGLIVFWRIKKRIKQFKRDEKLKKEGRIFDLGPEDVKIK